MLNIFKCFLPDATQINHATQISLHVSISSIFSFFFFSFFSIFYSRYDQSIPSVNELSFCSGEKMWWKNLQLLISYNNENQTVKIRSRKQRVQHTLKTKKVLYIITNVHAQTLLMTYRASIRCTQVAILALSSFSKHSYRTVQLQWLFAPSVSQ